MTTPALGGFDRALALLEFDQVRQRLAGYTRTILGRERALELTPVGDPREIGSRQQETDEARRFLDNGGGLEFGPGADLREYVQRAILGGALRGEELHQVQQLAGAGRFQPRCPPTPRRPAPAGRYRRQPPRLGRPGAGHPPGHQPRRRDSSMTPAPSYGNCAATLAPLTSS